MRDDRVSSALQDCAPSVILTTSSIVCDVAKYMSAVPGERAPVVVEIDSLNFDVPRDINSAQYPQPTYRISSIHVGLDPPTGRCGDLASELWSPIFDK